MRHGSASLAIIGPMKTPMALVGAAFALLLAAWVMSTPPFAAPDEASHYLRALSIANGHLLGPKVDYRLAGETPAQRVWARRDARAVLVPARLSPPDVRCADGARDAGPRGCIEVTPTGDYYPLAYLVPAVALKAASDASTGLWLARLASALPALGFLLLAITLVAQGGGWSFLGLLGAFTPMVLFAGSVVNPNGLEIAASLACAAAALRVARTAGRTPTWIWAALAASGVVTLLAWQLGIVFLLADLALGAALLGPTGLRELRISAPRQLVAVAVTLAAAFVIYLAYGLSSGVFHSSFALAPLGANLRAGLHQLHRALYGAVGQFGSLTVNLDRFAYRIWWLATLALIAIAVWLGPRREKALLALVAMLALAFPVVFYAFVYRRSGFGLQGRHVLPALALIPLTAGEVIQGARSDGSRTRSGTRLLAAVVALIAVFQLYAWWINARQSAGEPHSFWFLSHPLWSPPLGWWPWTALAVVGAGLLAGAAIALAFRRAAVAAVAAVAAAPVA
jgi:hypothetical protein